MDHGVTWLNFLPGYLQIQEYLQSTGKGLISGREVLFQHVAAALLVGLILLLVSSRARTQLNAAEGGGVVRCLRVRAGIARHERVAIRRPGAPHPERDPLSGRGG